jgi:hypothetical protein
VTYGTLNSMTIPPKQSRRLGFSILLTFSGGSDPRQAGVGGVVFTHPYLTNGPGVMTSRSQRVLLEFLVFWTNR